MKCYYHNHADAVTQCVDCGKALCRSCADKYEPILCPDCFNSRIYSYKSNLKKNIILSVVLFVVGLVLSIMANKGEFILNSFGAAYCLASLPWGWQVLNMITPNIFLFMPIIGWIVYFIIKLFLSIIIGWIVLPIKMIKSIVELRKLSRMK